MASIPYYCIVNMGRQGYHVKLALPSGRYGPCIACYPRNGNGYWDAMAHAGELNKKLLDAA